MIKRLSALVFIAAILASCGNTGKKEASTAAPAGGPVKVEFAALAANPGEYVGKSILVQGKVVHVCMESGKKLFIVGDNPDVRLYIQAGENMPKFPLDLMGSTVEVEGTITRPMAAAMATGHKEMAMEGKPAAGTDSCETEKALSGQSALADVMMEYKSHTVK